MKRYFAEFLGTFALVFAGCGAIVINDVSKGAITHVGIALTFGLVVMTIIYAIGDVSGAHLNPAVTIGFWISKRFETEFVGAYIISQLLGAFFACIILLILFPGHATYGASLPAGSDFQSFLLEVILTWFLMFVILCVSTGAKEKGMMAGVAVGGVIALEAMIGGPISGASMNPARSLAPAIVSGNISSIWIYIIAPTLGAALAVPCCCWVRGDQCCITEEDGCCTE